MSSPAQYIKQLRESNQALAEGMVKYAETIVALRRELGQARQANTLDVMDRAYFAGKDAGIAEAEAVARLEPDAGALHPKYHYHPTWGIYDAIREGSMSAEQFRHWCNWTAQETLAMVQQGQAPAPPNCHGDRT